MVSRQTYEPKYLEGIGHFNAGRFFEAHDAWEAVWMDYRGRSRRFYQGLIQMAVSLHHFGNGNIRGAIKLYAGSREKLEEYLPRHMGVDVAGLLERFARCCAAIVPAGSGDPRRALEGLDDVRPAPVLDKDLLFRIELDEQGSP